MSAVLPPCPDAQDAAGPGRRLALAVYPQPGDIFGLLHDRRLLAAAWPEIAIIWPLITRRDAPLCCKRSGQRGAFDSPAVGRRFLPHTAAVTLPRLMLGGQLQTWGAPAERSGLFSAADGGAGLAANHDSLAANRGRSRWRRSYSNVQIVVRNTSWFVSRRSLTRRMAAWNAVTAAGR
jgi:hypothetical protein